MKDTNKGGTAHFSALGLPFLFLFKGEEMERKFNDQQLARRKKLDDLVAKGINPFGNAYTRTANSKSIKDTYGACSKEELKEKKVEVSFHLFSFK